MLHSIVEFNKMVLRRMLSKLNGIPFQYSHFSFCNIISNVFSVKFRFYSLGCKLTVSHTDNNGGIQCVLVPFMEFIWPQHLHTHATCSKMSCIIYTQVN
jgi:hypothetical protein